MKEEELREFIGDDGHFSTIFDFSAHCLLCGEHGWYDIRPLDFPKWRDTLFDAQKKCGDIGFMANIIENHDEPRGVSRFLPEYARNTTGAKLLATTSVLLRGIPFIYQGQELGMENCPMEDVSEYDDISTKNEYRIALEAGLTETEALRVCQENSRDNARTPMQWSDEPNAGFTTGTPWLKVNPNYHRINAAAQEKDPDSVLNYYRSLIALRKSGEYRELFTYGDFTPVYTDKAYVFAYTRRLGERSVLIAGNYGQAGVELELPAEAGRLLLTNMPGEPELSGKTITLRPLQVIVIE